jgi:transposase
MVGEDRVIMRVKEHRRVHGIRPTRKQKLTQVQAATVLGLTPRYIRRLIERVEQAGDQGLVHQGRGRPSNRRIPDKVKTTVLTLYEKRYGDFGPTLATEKLAERHGITLSDETVRRWRRERGVVQFTRRKPPHRAWRARSAHVGATPPTGWLTP